MSTYPRRPGTLRWPTIPATRTDEIYFLLSNLAVLSGVEYSRLLYWAKKHHLRVRKIKGRQWIELDSARSLLKTIRERPKSVDVQRIDNLLERLNNDYRY